MVCTAHRLQCKTQHFPKHKFLVHATWNVQTQLKSTVQNYIEYSDDIECPRLENFFGEKEVLTYDSYNKY